MLSFPGPGEILNGSQLEMVVMTPALVFPPQTTPTAENTAENTAVHLRLYQSFCSAVSIPPRTGRAAPQAGG